MDIFKHLGYLALGSRLKRFSTAVLKEVSVVYRLNDIDFESKWFPTFYLLTVESPLAITEIAKQLNISHAAVNQFINGMLKKEIIEEVSSDDERKRMVRLSKKGEALHKKMQPLWRSIDLAIQKIVRNCSVDILQAVNEFEDQLEKKSFEERIMEEVKTQQIQEVEIIDYAPELKGYFKSLNLEWLEKYFYVEPIDERILSNPDENIISKGGAILFARYDDSIVGTCALKYEGNDRYELTKMAVTEKYQGKQIGKKLMQVSLEKAKEIGAEEVILYTHSSLIAAVNLYKKTGFKQIPLSEEDRSLYERTDIKMSIKIL